jgi:uncharacterized membrane protein
MTAISTQRRWIIAISSLGAANMGLGALRQFGVIHGLPDVGLRGFDSNAVMTSGPASVFGFPDTPLAAAGLVANIPLALAGGRDRERTHAWLPVVIAAKSVVEVSAAAWFLWQMKYRLHKWCAYCLLGASVSAIVAALSVDEAVRALPSRRARWLALGAAVALAAGTLVVMTALEDRRAGTQRPRVARGAGRMGSA